MYWLEKTKSYGCDKTKQGRDGQSKWRFIVYKKMLNQVKKKMRAKEEKKKKETKKKKGNGRYKPPFLNLAKITSLPPPTVNVQFGPKQSVYMQREVQIYVTVIFFPTI